jgi:hypothetical protein
VRFRHARPYWHQSTKAERTPGRSSTPRNSGKSQSIDVEGFSHVQAVLLAMAARTILKAERTQALPKASFFEIGGSPQG